MVDRYSLALFKRLCATTNAVKNIGCIIKFLGCTRLPHRAGYSLVGPPFNPNLMKVKHKMVPALRIEPRIP